MDANHYQGFGCSRILRDFNFAADSLTHCCVGFGAQSEPEICKFSGGVFPLEDYIKSAQKFVNDNLRQQGSCAGCRFLKEGVFSASFSGFKFISVNNFTQCQLKCYYCAPDEDHWRHKQVKPYNPAPTIDLMALKGILAPGCSIDFGGGEPAIYEHLSDILEVAHNRSLSCHINTNAVAFSPVIATALSNSTARITVSTDSGTKEGYLAVKGVDCFEKVRKNILKYAKCGDVRLKYNVNPFSLSQENLEGFVDIIVRGNIKKARFSPELNAYQLRHTDENFAELMNFARRLYLAVTPHITTPIDLSLYTPEDAAFIRGEA